MSYGMDIYFDHSRRELQIYLTRVQASRTYAIRPFEEVEIRETEMIDPCLRLRGDEGRRFLQDMMDAMWKYGVRPSGNHVNDQEKEVAAVRYHLEDLRKLVPALRGSPRV